MILVFLERVYLKDSYVKVWLGSDARFNKKLPLLLMTLNELDSIPIQCSRQLEMYSLNTWVSNIDLYKVIFDSIPQIDRAKRTYNQHNLCSISVNYINQRYADCYKIFTDGSKDKSGGGAAFIDPSLGSNVKIKIDSDISIMHIELIAIFEALSYVYSIDFKSFVILTDSKSSLQHLARCTSHVRGVPIAYRILESILKLQSENREVFLQWIPSHIQMKENDEVDLLAKQAIVDGIPLNELPLYSDLVKMVKQHCIDLWQEYFDERSREKGIWFRTIQPQISKYPWIDTIKNNREFLKTVLRLRSGHIPSNKFAFLMKKTVTPNCDDCGVIEDVLHVLTECVRNDRYRVSCFSSNRVKNNVGIINCILAEPTSKDVTCLVKLVKLGLDSH